MKKILIAILLLVFATSVQASDPNLSLTTWIFGNDENIGARVGYEVSENAEVGVVSYWWPEEDAPQVWGIYGIYFFPDLIEIRNPIPVSFLPETFEGKGYSGMQVGVNFDNDASFASPLAGVLFNEIFFLEYQYRAYDNKLEETLNDEHIFMIGLRFKW